MFLDPLFAVSSCYDVDIAWFAHQLKADALNLQIRMLEAQFRQGVTEIQRFFVEKSEKNSVKNEKNLKKIGHDEIKV